MNCADNWFYWNAELNIAETAKQLKNEVEE